MKLEINKGYDIQRFLSVLIGRTSKRREALKFHFVLCELCQRSKVQFQM